MIAGTKPLPERTGEMRHCPRCGIERYARKVTALCTDCRYVLTDEERPRWAS